MTVYVLNALVIPVDFEKQGTPLRAPLWGSSGEGRWACGGASYQGSGLRGRGRMPGLPLSPGETGTETGERR
jgi:hypothetical protein